MTHVDHRLTTSATLSIPKYAILIASGVAFWFLGALLIRAVEPLGALEGYGTALFYALIIPGTWPAIPLIRKLASLRSDETALGVTIVTATAVLLDGCALRLIPDLYGPNLAGAGAAILWGGGVALVLGVLMNRS